jgi:hypothetical protein
LHPVAAVNRYLRQCERECRASDHHLLLLFVQVVDVVDYFPHRHLDLRYAVAEA